MSDKKCLQDEMEYYLLLSDHFNLLNINNGQKIKYTYMSVFFFASSQKNCLYIEYCCGIYSFQYPGLSI